MFLLSKINFIQPEIISIFPVFDSDKFSSVFIPKEKKYQKKSYFLFEKIANERITRFKSHFLISVLYSVSKPTIEKDISSNSF